MSSKRYPEEFKIETVKQITERGHPVAEVASRIGVSQHSLYAWLKRYSLPESEGSERCGQAEEIRRLKAELKRVSEERDILKKATAYFAKESR
ncbi:MAG: transposase [Nitrosospira multiformis]|jgi:transposase|nr:transposase [Nitrosospira multiformis]